jgi:hypothetical protein
LFGKASWYFWMQTKSMFGVVAGRLGVNNFSICAVRRS